MFSILTDDGSGVVSVFVLEKWLFANKVNKHTEDARKKKGVRFSLFDIKKSFVIRLLNNLYITVRLKLGEKFSANFFIC